MIKPTGSRILAKMLPVYDGAHNPLGLTFVDKSKHFNHPSRKCRLIATGPFVKHVKKGDVVIIRGDAGRTLDGADVGYGEEYRWLMESDCLALEETAPEPEPQVVAEVTA